MRARFTNVEIKSVAAALPNRTLLMADFETQYGVNEVKRIVKGTGINAVRVACNLSTGDLCLAAARSLLDQSDIAADGIDGLVVVTQTPDSLMPGTGAWLQHHLSLPRGVAVVDINSGCSGYIYGLYQAAMMLSAGGCSRVLLLTGDVISKLLKPEDRHVRMVFGDGATATLLEHGNSRLSLRIETDGRGARHLRTSLEYIKEGGSLRGGYLHMNGAEVMGFAVSQVPRLISDLLDDTGFSQKDIPLFIMHQANQLILDYLRKKMGLEPGQVPIAVGSVGNTGPSSIPLFMAMTQASGLDRNSLENIVLCGFGVGLSLGAALTDLRNTRFFAPIYLDDPPLAATAENASNLPLTEEFKFGVLS
jgi:3-oxoacyl-[acyl-carrier-protein] synthase III